MSEIHGVHYWDMYFILKSLPIVEERVEVDIERGTRDYSVIDVMKGLGHLFVSECDGGIDAIASTKQGIQFFDFLQRIGFGTIETEEYGRRVIASYENGGDGMMEVEDDEEEPEDAIESIDMSAFDPFFVTAARLMIILKYDFSKLERVLQFDDDRFIQLKGSLIAVKWVDEEGTPW
ncbi:hypothetical protein WG906_09735 [Pedobacter sp. P351]|uniref:hypothetical protein n=1 Tax=Pedobacter superstes TaxID=3133441 RepID=UPI0030A9C3D1